MLLDVAGCGGGQGVSNTAGIAPEKLEANLFVCPSRFDTIGYRRRAYPSMYPSRPGSDIRPDRCFRSVDQAEEAGYSLARTPPGAIRMDGVYLVPPRRSLATYCRRAGRIARLPV